MEQKFIRDLVEEHSFLTRRFFEQSGERLEKAISIVLRTLQGGGKLILFGNGGSANTAQHIAAKLVGRYERERPGLPAIALTNDSTSLTSIAIDYGYDVTFARQVEAFAKKGDAAIAVSISGLAPNTLEGARAAKSRGLPVVALLGREGGRIGEIADVSLIVDAQKASRIQEVHLLIGHVICEAIEREMFSRG